MADDTKVRDPRLPYAEIDDSFLPPRDPVLGFVKVGGKNPTLRYTRAGKPWVAPTRLLDPARFEITTREKLGQKVKGKEGSAKANEDFTVDLGYVRDQSLHDVVGDQPSSLRVKLLYPRWNQNLITFLGAYGGGKWVCRGNGVEATNAKGEECACPCPRLIQFSGDYKGTHPNDGVRYKNGAEWRNDGFYPCKPHGQLNVILDAADVFGGFWPYKTTSFETISNLIKSLRMFEEMFKRVDGLPLELRVMAATKQLPGGGTTTQPIVTLVLPASMETARQVAADAAAESRKFLPAGRTLDEEAYREAVVTEMEQEAESYAEEFMPGEVLDAEEVEIEDDEEESGAGPSVPAGPPVEAGAGPGDQDATPSPDEKREGEPLDDAEPKSGDPDEPTGTGTEEGGEPSDPKGLEEFDRDDYQLATKVLIAAGNWTKESIRDRVEYHRKTGTLEKLLERLEKNHPEAWAKVAEPVLVELEQEPDDGLGS